MEFKRTQIAIDIAHQSSCHEDLLPRFEMNDEAILDESAANCEALLLFQEAHLVEKLILPEMGFGLKEK